MQSVIWQFVRKNEMLSQKQAEQGGDYFSLININSVTLSCCAYRFNKTDNSYNEYEQMIINDVICLSILSYGSVYLMHLILGY